MASQRTFLVKMPEPDRALDSKQVFLKSHIARQQLHKLLKKQKAQSTAQKAKTKNLLNDNGKVRFDLLKYNSNELFNKLPLFNEGIPQYHEEDEVSPPWNLIATGILNPYSHEGFTLEMGKRKISGGDHVDMPFEVQQPKKPSNQLEAAIHRFF